MTLFFLLSAFISTLIGIAFVVDFAFHHEPLSLVAAVVFALLAWILYKDADIWR